MCSFNPRARVGRDHVVFVSRHCHLQFQSTRPRGARPTPRGRTAWYGRVSIHAPAWGATAAYSEAIGRVDVSIHAPAWGATHVVFVSRHCHLQFQSTRPRGARRSSGVNSANGLPVSIHAPAWGATVRSRSSLRTQQVSIHAPAWGATHLIWLE